MDIVIVDKEYEMVEKYINSYMEELIRYCNSYIKICNRLAWQGQEDTMLLNIMLKHLEGMTNVLNMYAKGETNINRLSDFIVKIDEIDDLLY